MIDTVYWRIWQYFHYRGVREYGLFDDLIVTAEGKVPIYKKFYVLMPNKRLADMMLRTTVEIVEDRKHTAISKVNRLDRTIFLENESTIRVINYENPDSVSGLIGDPEGSAFYITRPVNR